MTRAMSWDTPARIYAKGIGDAVADRTVNRKLPDGRVERWEDVAYRVALGNTMLRKQDAPFEFEPLHHHLRQASILMSGRHLQHGDETQPTRPQEVFTNCSTAAASMLLFYLLLNGSGVGTAYDDDMMVVDWARNMPRVRAIVRADHPDVLSGEAAREAALLTEIGLVDFVTPYIDPDAERITYVVPDSREGWAKAIEQIVRLTWQATNADKVLVLDFSDVRPRGAPIGGMQNRPASGPVPLMVAIAKIAALRGSGLDRWEATMHVDHYLSECVLVGGARRAARMATKTWRDLSVFGFINVKRGGKLWSSNNSVTVDEEFWAAVKKVNAVLGWRRFKKDQGVTIDNLVETINQLRTHTLDVPRITELDIHAFKVFEAICSASYYDGTGEPGIINVERLEQKNDGIEVLFDGDFAESARFKLDDATKPMMAQIARAFAGKRFTQITNPCGEISLAMIGGYCVIADVVPYHASRGFFPATDDTTWDNDAEDAFRTATRALIRVNTMDCLYRKEVQRTNRIGVGITGLHEWIYARFGYGWKQIVDEARSLDMWQTLARFSRACVDEARRYSAELGVVMPHTVTTMKPAGTTSKLFGLTEGAHLPSMREYLRWVQFRNDDPLIAQYAAKGYPTRQLVTYNGTTIVGFPTIPEIVTLGMGDLLVTAAEATPEEQYEFLRLMEKYWINGFDGETEHSYGNQVSYTLKYLPKLVSYEDFRRTLMDGQSTIKCCSVMPQSETTAYEYVPEQPMSPEAFAAVAAGISDDARKEDIGFEHVDCGAGGCPIDFSEAKVA